MADFVLNGYTLSYPTPPINGLILYLDTSGKENEDTYKDFLLNMNNATSGLGAVLENVAYDNTSGYLTNTYGLHLDGIDDYLYGSLPSELPAATVEATIRLLSTEDTQILAQFGDDLENWAIQYNAGLLRLLHNDSVLATSTVDLTNTLSNKSCLTLTLTSTQVVAYVNTVEVLRATITLPIIGNTGDYFCIGSGFPSKDYTYGNLYSFRLYDRVLTQTEMNKNFKTDKKRWLVI